MKIKLLIVGVLAFFSFVGASSASPRDYGQPVVCGKACFDQIFNWGGVAGPVVVNPVPDDGDNASSVCKDRGGVAGVEFMPGYGSNGEAVTVAVVTCMDGSQHVLGGIVANTVNDPASGAGSGAGDGAGSGSSEPQTTYVQCPGIDNPAYDPNDEACW